MYKSKSVLKVFVMCFQISPYIKCCFKQKEQKRCVRANTVLDVRYGAGGWNPTHRAGSEVKLPQVEGQTDGKQTRGLVQEVILQRKSRVRIVDKGSSQKTKEWSTWPHWLADKSVTSWWADQGLYTAAGKGGWWGWWSSGVQRRSRRWREAGFSMLAC